MESPVLLEGASGVDPEKRVEALLGRSRGGTIKLRVRTWELFSKWLALNRGRCWPDTRADVEAYVHAMVDLPSPPSFPGHFGGALGWIAARCDMPNAKDLAEDPVLRKLTDWAGVELADEARLTAKAPRFTTIMVMALELLVVDTTAADGMRVVAWSRLLKLYASLRADDLQRLRPEHVQMREAGLVATLMRTKTSGVGRRVRELPVFIPRGAFTVAEHWLQVGYDLWYEHGPRNRDFFLFCPKPDMSGFTAQMATMGDLGAACTAVLAGLRVPVKDQGGEGEWAMGLRALLPDPLPGGWTGHSERPTLTSALAAVGVPKSSRDLLGRWSPSGSDDYVRTYRAMVKELTLRYTGTVSAGRSYEAYDEEEAYEAVYDRLAKRDFDEKELRIAIDQLKVTAANVARSCCAAESLASPTELASIPEPSLEEEPEAKDDGGDGEVRYLIVYTHNRKVARLHRAGGCWRARRRDFQDFDLIEVEPAPRDMYNTYCTSCWPGHGREPTVEEEAEGGSTSSTTSAGQVSG